MHGVMLLGNLVETVDGRLLVYLFICLVILHNECFIFFVCAGLIMHFMIFIKYVAAMQG